MKFVYIVVVGDTASEATFCYKVDAKLALCSDPSCSKEDTSSSAIFRLSSNPNQRADLTMKLVGGTLQNGVPFVDNMAIVIDTSDAAPTIILSVTVPNGPGRFTSGDILTVLVRFTDVVFCVGTYPTLHFNVRQGGYDINYASGDSLFFNHIITEEDGTEVLAWVLYPGSNTAILCEADIDLPRSVKNENSKDVDVGFVDEYGNDVFPQLDGSVEIDQDAPHITSVFTSKTPSSDCEVAGDVTDPLRCTFAIGEEITIFVAFDLPGVVLGSGPRLVLDNGNVEEDGTYLSYIATVSNDYNNLSIK